MAANKGLNKFSIGSFNSQIQSNFPLPSYKVGRVFGTLLNENTPSKEAFKQKGWGGLGGIWYKPYLASKSEENQNVDILKDCKFALPVFPNQKIFVAVFFSDTKGCQFFANL